MEAGIPSTIDLILHTGGASDPCCVVKISKWDTVESLLRAASKIMTAAQGRAVDADLNLDALDLDRPADVVSRDDVAAGAWI